MRFLTAEEFDDLDFVRQVITNTGIMVRSFERLPGGVRSAAYAADNLVVRFPKAEVIWRTMQREKKVIDALMPHLENKVPNKVHKIELIEEEYPFSVSKRFTGKICDNRGEGEHTTDYAALTLQQQENLARQIAKFFAALHSFDYETADIPSVDADIVSAMESWNVSKRRDFDADKVRAALLQHSAEKIDLNTYKDEDNEVAEALCHNDLSGSNMLIEPEEYNVLNGVIDFGNARVIPVAEEFFPLYKINRKLALDTLKIYNKIVTYPLSQKQIDGLALRYIGYGLTRCTDNVPNTYLMRLLKMFD
ncbi:MAG: aminoglycoside phosphotransferase family protein [Alphaproteobacteria bacterium]|nr:aminoglycoside phosphotransferase family protein [Alphaproteobacteria bacterium]